MSSTSPKHHFDRIVNFRDVGGLPTSDGACVRQGQLFRSAILSHASEADLGRLYALDIRTVVDLRTPAELTAHGRAHAEAFGASFHHVPLLTEVWDSASFDHGIDAELFLAARYDELLEHNGASVTKAVLAIADSSGPAVVHCTAGKDRTGIITAMLLSCIGVTDAVIANDYARSASAMAALRAQFEAEVPGLAVAMAGQPSAFSEAPREAMLRTLTALRWNHGSVPEYLTANGLPSASLRALRQRLVVVDPRNVDPRNVEQRSIA